MTNLVFKCPWCEEPFVVAETELNCRILRHFSFYNLEPLNPHAPLEECKRVVEQGLGYGCAGPIELVCDETTGEWTALPSDYTK